MLLKNRKSSFGRFGEDYAASLLKEKGYRIVSRNFRSRFGEIDIIAICDWVVVIVEVKTRYSLKFGHPEEAVTKQKLNKIRRTAEYFSITHPTLPKKMRIEVVAIEISSGKIISSKIIPVDY